MMISILIALLGFGAQEAEIGAAVENDNWIRSNVTFSYERAGRDLESQPIPTVYTSRTDIPGAFFVCDASSYRVRLAEKPMQMYKVADGVQKRNVRQLPLRLYIDGEIAYRGQADIWTQLDAVAPQGREPAAMLFNAVVKGQMAAFSIGAHRNIVPIHLPSADEEFADFANSCAELQSGEG